MSNLVLCGGSGAHGGLAFVRLWSLLRDLYSFDGHTLEFPQIYLIDQDVAGEGSAWSLAEREIQRLRLPPPSPSPKVLSPLPLGAGGPTAANETLAARFGPGSETMSLLVSRDEQTAPYLTGMMGCPRLGSVLFELKQNDTVELNGRCVNRDPAFADLLQSRVPTVVMASSVGGTGSGVGPTLPRLLSADAKVLTVLVMQWFELTGTDENKVKATERNRRMEENSSSGFRFYATDLSGRCATLPLGIPAANFVRREWKGDNGQPHADHFLHVVAGAATLQHFFAPHDKGLYFVPTNDNGALDPKLLLRTGDFPITLIDAVSRSALLCRIVRAIAAALRTPGQGLFSRPSEIVARIPGAQSHAQIADELDNLISSRQIASGWMKSFGVNPAGLDDSITLEKSVSARLKKHAPEFSDGSAADAPTMAKALHDWACRWVRDVAAASESAALRPDKDNATRFYWPPKLDPTGAEPQAATRGAMKSLDANRLENAVKSFIDPARVKAVGYPDVLSTPSVFKHVLKNEVSDPRTLLKHKLLLLGLADPVETLRLMPTHFFGTAAAGSFDGLSRTRLKRPAEALSLAAYATRKDKKVFYGANDSRCLFFPATEASDADWQGLFVALGFPAQSQWQDWDGQIAATNLRANAAAWALKDWLDDARIEVGGDNVAPAWFGSLPSPTTASRPAPIGTTAEMVRFRPDDAAGEFMLPRPGRRPSRIDNGWMPAPADLDPLKGFVLAPEDWGGPHSLVWEERLELLRASHTIARAFVEGGSLNVQWTQGLGERFVRVYPNTQIIKLGDVLISSYLRVADEGLGKDKVRPPDVPLRGEYLGLLRDKAGKSVIAEYRKDLDYRLPSFGVVEIPPQHGGGHVARWSDIALFKYPKDIAAPTASATEPGSAEAHWMVWPSFRSEPGRWSTYYFYPWSTSVSRLRALTVDPQHKLHLGEAKEPHNKPALAAPPSAQAVPIGLEARDQGDVKGLGIWWTHLRAAAPSPEIYSMALDFGTANTAVAVRSDTSKVLDAVRLGCEPEAKGQNQLTLEVIKCRRESANATKLATWQPTYCAPHETEGDRFVIPTELSFTESDRMQKLDEARPLVDFTIPSAGYAPEKLEGYVVGDFKWVPDRAHLREQGRALRRLYLHQVLELALADLVRRSGFRIPGSVKVTALYPLRQTAEARSDNDRVMKELFAALSAETGIALTLSGWHSESHAAMVTSGQPELTTIVADLGGGTLDLFVATKTEGNAADSDPELEVCDSIRIGGHLLLDQLVGRRDAAKKRQALPSSWDGLADEHALRTLRYVIRATGVAMFRINAGTTNLSAFGVDGFATDTEDLARVQRARQMIDRYFHGVSDCIARTITAYLQTLREKKIQKGDRDVQFSLQLRGNGWHLFHDERGYDRVQDAIAKRVWARVHELWKLGPLEARPVHPAEPSQTPPDSQPKLAPVRNSIGKGVAIGLENGRFRSISGVALGRIDGTSPGKRPPNHEEHWPKWFDVIPIRRESDRKSAFLYEVYPPIKLDSSTSIQKLDSSMDQKQKVGEANGHFQRETSPTAGDLIRINPMAEVFEKFLLDAL